MENNEVLKEYMMLFDEQPYLLMSLNYNHDIYQELMKKAIERFEPLTEEEVIKAFKETKYDLGE